MNISRAMMPDLLVLQAFEAAARHNNFTKAARELNLTQSAVSRQIRALEEQLGVALFERVRKRVHLSAAGRQILPDVTRLLAQSEEIILKARSAAQGGSKLSIATLPTFGNRWLMPRLSGFLEHHPGLTIEIISRLAPLDLHTADFDVAIHYGQPVLAHATCTYLCSEDILPVASPALIKDEGTIEPHDLLSMELLHLTTRPKLWSDWFHSNGIDNENAYLGNRFDQFSMIIEAALHGMGLALLPRYLIEKELACGQLKIIVERAISTENNYYIVLPEGGNEAVLAKSFQTWMLEEVG